MCFRSFVFLFLLRSLLFCKNKLRSLIETRIYADAAFSVLVEDNLHKILINFKVSYIWDYKY